MSVHAAVGIFRQGREPMDTGPFFGRDRGGPGQTGLLSGTGAQG